ncbi:hypothetical protein CFAM422_005192 [Trichoderma lentiforme]|uniref:Uncharacterized protein n=1 Tax=Trichoderma lentiforme TaxID=1567552 RepID=A0A9P4XGY9_9HYPO|nr:hypothetical protein CFAM422_005192 [Trichoderma lentiforme]
MPPLTHCSLQAANALSPLQRQWPGEAFCPTLILPRAVASAPDPRPGGKSTCFVRAGGGNGPGEGRRKGAEPQTSFKPDDSTAQSPREGVECVS